MNRQGNIKAKARELLANAPVTRFIGHDFVPKEAALRAIEAAIAFVPPPVVVIDAYCDNVLDPLWHNYGEDSIQYQMALAAYRQIRQRPVVDDAMVERALGAPIPGGGQVRDFGLPRYAVVAALRAAYQQDNGGR